MALAQNHVPNRVGVRTLAIGVKNRNGKVIWPNECFAKLLRRA